MLARLADPNYDYYDRASGLRGIINSPSPVVVVTIRTPAMRTVPVYGLGQYSAMGQQADILQLHNCFLAFLGNGDSQPWESLHLIPLATMGRVGTWTTTRVVPEATLVAHFGAMT